VTEKGDAAEALKVQGSVTLVTYKRMPPLGARKLALPFTFSGRSPALKPERFRESTTPTGNGCNK
jgi:hypothetical protein